MIIRIPGNITKLNRLYKVSNADCVANLRMDQNTFARLYFLLRELRGLTIQKYVGVEEQVAMFLCVLAHHKKQRLVKFDCGKNHHLYKRRLSIIKNYESNKNKKKAIKPWVASQEALFLMS
ncbi:hypothetical protein ACS0TY_008319 [Phlomoides rotata]